MVRAEFIAGFFGSKKVSLLTAFLCWQPAEITELCHGFRISGARLRVVSDFNRLPPLPAYGPHREGMLLDLDCPNASLVLEKVAETRALNLRHTWLVLGGEEALDTLQALPDSDVTWAPAGAVVGAGLADVYREAPQRPLRRIALPLTTDCSLRCFEQFWAGMDTTVTRRKNLHSIILNSDVIVSQPQYFKNWNDMANRQIDTFPKVTYPLMLLVAEDLNFRYNMRQVDQYGVERNGSFDGLVGRLQRQEIEVGVASVFMRADRWRVMHYSAETIELRGAFLFRQPSQSSVTNVFLLPFSRHVWATSLSLYAAAVLVLLVLVHMLRGADPNLRQITPAEVFTFTVGTICQQGTHVVPALLSVRAVMFSMLMLSLFSFTAYSAKIVSILQAPSDAIQTIDDITRSRMTCGVQETTYKKIYFAESNDPATQRLYHKKLLPQGEAAYMSVVDGIARMRRGLFAFQVEESSGYDIISQTFTEREKCGLQQIQAFKLPMVCVPLRKHSGYRDIFAARLRWLRECGVMQRERQRWMAGRPRCEAASSGFVSVGLTDVLPALQILAVGELVAMLLLLAETALSHGRAWHQASRVI